MQEMKQIDAIMMMMMKTLQAIHGQGKLPVNVKNVKHNECQM